MGVEEIENTTPGHCLRLQADFVPDTGGPGKHRGGVSSVADILWLVDSTHVAFHGHLKSPPGGGGVAGGLPGSVGGAWAWTPRTGVSSSVHELPTPLTDPRHGDAIPLFGVMTPDSHVLHPDGTFFAMDRPEHLPAGSIVRTVSNAAGGWGDPLERDPALVLRDVRDEYVTLAGAARDYGVVVCGDPATDPEGLILDQAATTALRERMRNG
jgi:N-methylhydantoinase B